MWPTPHYVATSLADLQHHPRPKLSKPFRLGLSRPVMKPIVGAGTAWFCTVLSVFGVIILSALAALFYTNHESMMGSINDPEDGKAVAKTILGAVAVYAGFFLCCGSQILVQNRQNSVRL